ALRHADRKGEGRGRQATGTAEGRKRDAVGRKRKAVGRKQWQKKMWRRNSVKRAINRSAQRTNENSPAIYRWDGLVKYEPKSAKRTAENLNLTSVARFTGFAINSLANPALKCWAIFKRPLRGRFSPITDFLRFAFLILLTAHSS